MVDQPLPSKDLQNDALRGSSTAGGHPRRSGAGETNAGRRERSRAGVNRRGRYGGRDRGTERTRRLERGERRGEPNLRILRRMANAGERAHGVVAQPTNPKYRLVHIGFTSPGGPTHNVDKNACGYRYDSIGICNGVINAGASCERLQYDPTDPARMAEELGRYDGYIVRINPGQLSRPGVPTGAQQVFDELMDSFVHAGKPVWSSPQVQKSMGAKDALVRINRMACGLPDTLAYYTPEEFRTNFVKTAAFQPRVIKQNRGSAGEGIWLCWLVDKPHCEKFGDAELRVGDRLKLMEMNDEHVEYHTVGEFMEFCVNGPDDVAKAGTWHSVFPGKYLTGQGSHLVDQRLMPRIAEGEVRMLMVRDQLFQIIHKKPKADGGMSAVGGNNVPTFYKQDAPEFAGLREKFIKEDVPRLLEVMELQDQPLPLLWTADFIPMDSDEFPGGTVYKVGEFNCSCVGVSKFMASAKGGVIEDVSDEDYWEGMRLCDLIGKQVVEAMDTHWAALQK